MLIKSPQSNIGLGSCFVLQKFSSTLKVMGYIAKLSNRIEYFGEISNGTLFEFAERAEKSWAWIKVSEEKAILVSGSLAKQVDSREKIRVAVLLRFPEMSTTPD